MQPYLFPYLGYWQMLAAVDIFVVFDDVNYIKKGYINRNSILLAGQVHKFTLELHKASINKLINEITITGENAKLVKTFKEAYSKAPFFTEVMPILEDILLFQESRLHIFITNSLRKICEYLEIKTKVCLSSEISKEEGLKGEDKILAIVKSLNGKQYINAIGGLDLYDKEKFLTEGIALSFIKMDEIKYRQFNENFIPFLSIVDVLMFNSVEKIKIFLNNYSLVN